MFINKFELFFYCQNIYLKFSNVYFISKQYVKVINDIKIYCSFIKLIGSLLYNAGKPFFRNDMLQMVRILGTDRIRRYFNSDEMIIASALLESVCGEIARGR